MKFHFAGHRFITRFSVAVAIVALFAIASGCRLADPGESGSEAMPLPAADTGWNADAGPGGRLTTATLKPGVRQLENSSDSAIVSFTPAASGTDGNIVVRLGNDTPAPTAGQVLVVTEGAGQVVRVRSATTNPDGTTTLVTEPGRLSDAYDALDMTFTLELTPDTVDGRNPAAPSISHPTAPTNPGQSLSPGHREITGPTIDLTPALRGAESRPHIHHDLAGTVIYDNGRVKVEIVEGSVDIYAILYADYHLIQDSDIKYSLSVRSNATLKTTVSQEFSAEGEVPIPSAAWSTTLRLGRANVRLKAGLFAGYQVNANAAMSVQSTVTYSEMISGAIAYNTFSGITGQNRPTRNQSFTRTPPIIEAQADAIARVYLKPQVLLEIMSTTAVDCSVEAFARLAAEYHYSSVLGHSYGWLLDLGAAFSLRTFPERPNLPIHLAHEGEIVFLTFEQHRRLVHGKILGDPTGVRVTVRGTATDLPPGPFSRTVDARADGTFVVSGVPKGEMTVVPSHEIETFEPVSHPVTIGAYDLRNREDPAPKDAEKDFEMVLVIEPVSPIQTPAGMAVSQQVRCHGGKGQRIYTWSATNLPPGLSLTPTTQPGVAQISGTVSAQANPTYTATIVVEDDAGSRAERQIVFNLRALRITNLVMGQAQEGVAYSHAFVATGGTEPYTYVISGLPAGLAATNQGVVSGTAAPGAGGSHVVTIQVSDAGQPPASAEMTTNLRVIGGEMVLPPADRARYFSTGQYLQFDARSDTLYEDAVWSSDDLPSGWRIETYNQGDPRWTAEQAIPRNIHRLIVRFPENATGFYEPTFTLRWNGNTRSLRVKIPLHLSTRYPNYISFEGNRPYRLTLTNNFQEYCDNTYYFPQESDIFPGFFAGGSSMFGQLENGDCTLEPYAGDNSRLPAGCKLVSSRTDGNWLLLNFTEPGEHVFTVKQTMRSDGSYFLYPFRLTVKPPTSVLRASPWPQVERYQRWLRDPNGTPYYSSPRVDDIPFHRGVIPLDDEYTEADRPIASLWIDEWNSLVPIDSFYGTNTRRWYANLSILSLRRSYGYSLLPEPGRTYNCVLYLIRRDGSAGRIPFTLRTPAPSEVVTLVEGVDDQEGTDYYRDERWSY